MEDPRDISGTLQAPQQDLAIKSQQFPPFTVSAPAIHYTTDVDASAEVHRDSIFFVAYNRTRQKRILHVLSVKDEMSLKAQRPLVLEDSPQYHGTTSIFDLVLDKFSDDPPSLHIICPQPGFSCIPPATGFFAFYKDMYKVVTEHRIIEQLESHLHELSRLLPNMTLNVRSWRLPPLPADHPPGPRTIQVSRHSAEKNLVVLDSGHGIYLKEPDVFL